MSLKRKHEQAIKALLVAGRPAGNPVVAGIVAQIVTSFENQTTVKSGTQRVIINAVSGQLISVKSRSVRMRTEVLVETSADYQNEDATTPEDAHSALVIQVHKLLDDDSTPLAQRLSALGGTTAAIGNYGCTFVAPFGELQLPPTEIRDLREGWGYNCVVMEAVLS